MNQFLLLILAIGLLLLGAVYGLPYLQKPNPDDLASVAISASDSSERVVAAQELSRMEGEQAQNAVRKVLSESDDEQVIAVCIQSAARSLDYECIDFIIEQLDSQSVNLRATAAKALIKLLGRNFHFPVRGKQADRDAVKQQIIEDWKAYDGSPLYKINQKRFGNENG